MRTIGSILGVFATLWLAIAPALGASVVRPTPGSIDAWSPACFSGATWTSLASGSAVVAATGDAIAQQTNLDDYLSVSFSFVIGGTTTAGSYLTLYLLPLNQDGTTYGDNTTPGASTATPPAASYIVSSVQLLAGATSGTTVVGTFPAVFIGTERQPFILAIADNAGVAFNSTGTFTVSCQTTNTNGNG